MSSMKNFGCKTCGSYHVRERDGKLYCVSCGAVFALESETKEQRDARILFLARLDDAEKCLRISPPRFDDAEDMYRDFIKQYPDSSDGYWGLVRARYGIKYEVDIDGSEIPTCYMSSYEDIRQDHYFRLATEKAESNDLHQKYISEGNRIAAVCKEWRDEASKYSYDVFISFKATDDETKEETSDSREMQKLYTYLLEEGYKVFFSPVSMKRYTGKHYDAYIFNALQKAKVMIVYGSKPEYFTTTWVENEWSRYLRLMQKNEKKKGSCIVTYDGFSPSDLPRQLREIQALDASKENRSFYRDITNCIDGILREDTLQNAKKSSTKQDANKSITTPNIAKNEEYVFDESEIFHSESVNLRRFMLYGERDNLNEVISLAQALFASVGGAINTLFSNMIDKRCHKNPATAVSIEDDGICGTIDGRIISAGSEEYMHRRGIEISPYKNATEEFTTSKIGVVMYLAENDKIKAKFFIHYKIRDDFLTLITVLSKSNITPTIYIRDPNISYRFVEELTDGKYQNVVNVIKQKKALSTSEFIKKNSSKNKNRCFDLLNKLAQDGNADAMYGLGCCYNQGYGTACDKKKAIKLFKSAAKKGNAEALYELGYMHYVKKERLHHIIARIYFQKAAKLNNVDAQYRLGVMYEEGKGVSKS